jgi:hypothetical protein
MDKRAARSGNREVGFKMKEADCPAVVVDSCEKPGEATL